VPSVKDFESGTEGIGGMVIVRGAGGRTGREYKEEGKCQPSQETPGLKTLTPLPMLCFILP
jgi:hypothetical protein